MSIDTYLCLCCLSTNDLCNLYDKNAENNYVKLLKDMFRISDACGGPKVNQISFLQPAEDAEDDYICKTCIGKLKEANSFKNQVLKSIDTLKVIGLIKVHESNGNLIINKVDHIVDEDEDTKTDIKNKDLIEDQKPDLPITVKQVKDNKLENVTITKNSDIIRSFLANDPVKKLERDIAASDHKSFATPVFDPKDLNGEDLRCKTCDEKLPNLYAFNLHLNKHFPNHICEICGKGYVTERKLKRHKYSHVTGPFVCEDCGVKYTNYSTYSTHRHRKHSNPLPYKCPLCPASFRSVAERARHGVTAHDQRPRYSCLHCTREFLTSGLLSSHTKNKHLKTKRHSCSDCGTKFISKQELAGHMARHTGHKVFECHLCDKSYPRKKSLIVHLRGHNNDKRFACDVCDKKFVQKSTLTSHLKTHNRAKKKSKSEECNLKIEEEKVDVKVSSIIKIEPYKQVKKE